MKTVELLRHTANEGDQLTAAGIRAALNIGAALPGGYTVAVSSGAQRATQTVACLLAGLGAEVPDGVVVVDALRSSVEDEWRSAYQAAGTGDLDSLKRANPDLVDRDSAALAEGLRTIFALLPEDGRALAVGHSPTNEAAIYGLTGVIVEPIPKGGSVVIATVGDGFLVDDR
jgi:broad specificity phosphatase PhoE